ncbi:MAG: STAS domain-containing protein, partial [Myxococcaceae bacterium]
STSPTVDLAGARMLATLHSELTAAGTGLRLVDARASVRDILRAEGLETLVGDFGRGTSVALAVDELQGRIGARVPPA